MAKIPFSIDYKPQIESGEYKVVTGDDRPVRIISWDKKVFGGRIEIVGLVPTSQGDTETVQLYCPDGTLIVSGWNENFKLFIVTPKPELTEFEKRVEEICNSYESGKRDSKEQIRYYSAELLDLAREEIMGEWSKGLRDTQDRSGKAYNDGYNFGFEIGYERGKAEALKDLPMWKKRDDFDYPTQFCGVVISGGQTTTLPVVIADGYEIPISELLNKLPKED